MKIVSAAERPELYRNLVVQVCALAMLLYILGLFAIVKGSNAINELESLLRNKNGAIIKDAVVADSVWIRAMDQHWVAALVLQPRNINKSAVTAIFHFTSANGVPESVFKIELLKGNMSEPLKIVSSSTVNPLTLWTFVRSRWTGFTDAEKVKFVEIVDLRN